MTADPAPKTSQLPSFAPPRPEIQQAIAGMLEGLSAAMLAREITEGGQNPDEILMEAAEYFANISMADSDVIRGFCLEATREIYRKLMRDGKHEEALKAVKMLFQMAPDNV